MRLFVGIEIAEDVKAHLQAALAPLRPLSDLRWSPIENLHITTKFIGEWPENRLHELQTALADVRARESNQPITIAIRGLGWFPIPHRPRFFWAGVHGGGELPALASATERALLSLGIPAEKREFRSHLTLARVKEGARLESVRRAVAALPTQDFGSFVAGGFVLYFSEHTAAQQKYTKLAEFPLSNL